MSADILKSPGLGSRAAWRPTSSEIPLPRCRCVGAGVVVGVGFRLGASERSAQTNGFPLDAFTRAGRTTPLRPTASHMGVVMQAWCPCRSRFHRLTQVWCHSSKPHPISSRRPFISSQQRHSRHNVSRSPSTLQIVHARAGCRSVFRRQPDRAKSAPPPDSVNLARPVVAFSHSVSSCDSVISHARTVNKEDSTESPNPPRTDARTTGDQAKMPSSLESSRPIMAPSVRYPATAPPKHPT